MRVHLLIATAAFAVFAAGLAHADPVANLSDGLAALDRHDAEAAARLLGDAIASGMLSSANQELALVKRGEARLLFGKDDDALADARAALALNPNDPEAAEVRAYALSAGVPAPHGPTINRDTALNAEVAARNAAVTTELDASQAQYRDQLTAYQAQKTAGEQAYAEQLAAYHAKVDADAAAAKAAQAAWQAQVKACKSGHYEQCGPRK